MHHFAVVGDGEIRCLDCDCRQGGTASTLPCGAQGQDTVALARDLIRSRRDRLGYEKDAEFLEAVILRDVADLDADIARLNDQRAERVRSHPQAQDLRDLQAVVEETTRREKETLDALKMGWALSEKSVRLKGGLVTRSTRAGVRVTDSAAAARDLLERRLWAFVKDLKVDAKGLRPLLDQGGVAGVVVDDAFSITVKLNEAD